MPDSQPQRRIGHAPSRLKPQMPIGHFLSRAEQPLGQRRHKMPAGEDGDESDGNYQPQQRNNQHIRRESGERDAMKVKSHRHGEADLNRGGDHGHFVHIETEPRHERQHAPEPARRDLEITGQRFSEQPQLDAKLRGLGREAGVAAGFRDPGERSGKWQRAGFEQRDRQSRNRRYREKR